jgi:hypothetical protein
MRRRAILLSIVILSVPALWRAAEACGDKLLLVGRGVKFGRAYASEYPGHILVYAQPSIDLKAPIRDPGLYKRLRQAGHAVSVIENATLLEQALRTVAIDVVLADVAEATALEPLAAAGLSRPATRYVLSRSSNKEEAKRLQQQFTCPLKGSDGAARYLDVIEETMKERRAIRRAGRT